LLQFYINFWCCYMNNSKGKFFKHKCYNLVEIIGKKLRFLEIKIIKFHYLGFLCTHWFFSFSTFWGKFKFYPKPNGTIEMCFFVTWVFWILDKIGCDKLSFHKQHFFFFENTWKEIISNFGKKWLIGKKKA
jgi:hypothetical protein